MISPSSYDPRSRRACEPCRRKKAKCPGEKPVCSFCKRLNQPCEYRTRDLPKGSSRRITDFEHAPIFGENFQNGDANMLEGDPDGLWPSLSIADLEPPSQVLRDLVIIYRLRIHHQPIPLFKPEDLAEQLTLAPRFLVYSFLALVLTLQPHAFYQGKVSEAIHYYTRSSEKTVRSLSSRAMARLEVVQALCLQAVREVMACKPGQAWMTIGTASRLEAYRILLGDTSHNDAGYMDLSARCHWSVQILEAVFGPHQAATSKTLNVPNYPQSAPWPPMLPGGRGDDCPSDLYNMNKPIEDLGITAYYIKMVLIWSKLSTWLSQIRQGRSETPWQVGSNHTTLSGELFEHERRLPHKHLLRNVSFSKRPHADIDHQREYWVAWVLMQVMAHAAPAILNHPFIHLVALNHSPESLPSALFLQQTVDLALFHSGWVFRLLRMCEIHQLEIHDPFVGYLVASLATISWLFQFAVDEKISVTAKTDLAWCKEYLRRMSLTWPHISQKVEILEKLQLVADHYRQKQIERDNVITFHPSLFWALLDPEICQMTPPNRSIEGSSQIPDARIRITTHYTHPLVEQHAGEQVSSSILDSDCNFDDSNLLNSEELEQVYLDDLFAHFMQGHDQEF